MKSLVVNGCADFSCIYYGIRVFFCINGVLLVMACEIIQMESMHLFCIEITLSAGFMLG